MPVYCVPVNNEEHIIAADNKSQAIRAATLPLLGEVRALSPNQIAEKITGGAELKNASGILAGQPAEDGNEEEK